MMFVPHVMILWFREHSGACVDIKIGYNDDLHDCLNKSATLLDNKAFFALSGSAAGVFVYTEWHKEVSEWVHLRNEQCIHWIHPVFSSSFHSLGFLQLKTWQMFPLSFTNRKLYHRSGSCILLALHSSGLWESNKKYTDLVLLLMLKEWDPWPQEV